MSELCLDYGGFLAVCARLSTSVALEAYGVALLVTVGVDEMLARESVDPIAFVKYLQAYRTCILRPVSRLLVVRLGV